MIYGAKPVLCTGLAPTNYEVTTMTRGTVKLENPARFSVEHKISQDKINKAIKAATQKLESKLELYSQSFVGTFSTDGKYPMGENTTWVSGMHTGTMLLAYELTGNTSFLDAVVTNIPSYKKRIDEQIKLSSHDVGFIYSPSCVGLYKLTGNADIREIALKAAQHLYDKLYSQKGGFILRMLGSDVDCHRTMMDTLLNIPLFFWAYEETGEKKYLDAANSQLKITNDYLIRPDGSSYHHYQFDPDTHKPLHGCTFQGHRDESTWSRGHSWGVYGFPMAYGYNGDEALWPLHRDVTYFMLNHLPKDNIPYWDYDFVDECDQARDISAGLISACGMMEACKYLSDNSPERTIYQNAASMILEAAIDKCADYEHYDFDGLVNFVTCSAPHGLGVNECALYGDFFYLEALLRYTRPEWKMYW